VRVSSASSTDQAEGVNCGRTAWSAALSARLGQAAADPERNRQRTGTAWTLRTVITILSNPRYPGRHVWNRQRTDRAPAQDVTAARGPARATAPATPGTVCRRTTETPTGTEEATFRSG
jgi:Recombinase